MKFLILQKPLPVPGSPETMKAASEALEASLKVIDDLKAKGTVESVYGLTGVPGGVVIFDVKSHEELDQLMMQLPITGMGKVEVYPLSDIKAVSESLKRTVAQSG